MQGTAKPSRWPGADGRIGRGYESSVSPLARYPSWPFSAVASGGRRRNDLGMVLIADARHFIRPCAFACAWRETMKARAEERRGEPQKVPSAEPGRGRLHRCRQLATAWRAVHEKTHPPQSRRHRNLLGPDMHLSSQILTVSGIAHLWKPAADRLYRNLNLQVNGNSPNPFPRLLVVIAIGGIRTVFADARKELWGKRGQKSNGPELGISGPALREWRWEGTHRQGCCLC